MKMSTIHAWLCDASVGQIIAARDIAYEDRRKGNRHLRRIARRHVKLMTEELRSRAPVRCAA